MGRRAGIALALGVACLLGACATQQPVSNAVPPEPLLRAFGNEPGWTVTVYADSLVYLTNYGEDRYVFTHFVARSTGPGTFDATHRTIRPDPPFEMAVSEKACADDMSGEPFGFTVTVEFESRTYRGCGRTLN